MRLIDADAITKWLDKHYDDEQITVGFFDGLIKRSPTVDAVPVIRCRDCRYHKGYSCERLYGTQDAFTLSDDYCSRAERKEE